MFLGGAPWLASVLHHLFVFRINFRGHLNTLRFHSFQIEILRCVCVWWLCSKGIPYDVTEVGAFRDKEEAQKFEKAWLQRQVDRDAALEKAWQQKQMGKDKKNATDDDRMETESEEEESFDDIFSDSESDAGDAMGSTGRAITCPEEKRRKRLRASHQLIANFEAPRSQELLATLRARFRGKAPERTGAAKEADVQPRASGRSGGSGASSSTSK